MTMPDKSDDLTALEIRLRRNKPPTQPISAIKKAQLWNQIQTQATRPPSWRVRLQAVRPQGWLAAAMVGLLLVFLVTSPAGRALAQTLLRFGPFALSAAPAPAEIALTATPVAVQSVQIRPVTLTAASKQAGFTVFYPQYLPPAYQTDTRPAVELVANQAGRISAVQVMWQSRSNGQILHFRQTPFTPDANQPPFNLGVGEANATTVQIGALEGLWLQNVSAGVDRNNNPIPYNVLIWQQNSGAGETSLFWLGSEAQLSLDTLRRIAESMVVAETLSEQTGLVVDPTPSPISPASLTEFYVDPVLNFSLRYPTNWQLSAAEGATLNDGSGRTITLQREDYLLEIKAQFRPDNPGGCGGLFHQDTDSTDDYRHYQVDGVALWRPKLENGFTNGYNDGTLTFASVISPAPDHNSYICSLEIDNRLFAIDYRLPVSLGVIEAGRYRADLLAEMDEILQSIQWHVDGASPPAVIPTATPVHPPQTALTPTPLGYDATVTTAPGEPAPDEISQIKAANANQPEIMAPLFTPDGQWRAQTRVYGCVEIGPNQVMAYEELVLTDLNTDAEVVTVNQIQNCGGLGAAGLAALFWSPSGRYLYYTNARDGIPDGCGFWQPPILRWDRATGQTEPIGSGMVSPDGTRLAVWPGRERAIALWNLDGNELGRVPAAADALPGQIAWSPDSRTLVYLQVSSYCPLAGPSYLVQLDLNTLTQGTILTSTVPAFRQVSWPTLEQIHLLDEQSQTWYYHPADNRLQPEP